MLELGKIVVTTSFKDYNCGLNGWMSFRPKVKGEKFILIYLGTESEEQERINDLVMDFLKGCSAGALEIALDSHGLSLSGLCREARNYIQVEREYYEAHQRQEAGPGICIRRKNVELQLTQLINKIEKGLET